MVYAQITCSSARFSDHTDTDEAYASRPNLQVIHAGDVYAAMCCFGLCATDGTVASLASAIADIPSVERVERKVIAGCRVDYNSTRDATLYDPSEQAGVQAHITEDGVVTTTYTGAGAHFIETDASVADAQARMDQALDKARRTYCQPQDQDAGAGVQPPFALDYQDCLYVLDQGHIAVPVLVYNDQVCVDYTSGALVQGIMVIDNANGIARPCSTRDLYSSLELDQLYNIGGGSETLPIAYTRRITALDEPLGARSGMESSTATVHDWLTSTFGEQHKIMGYGYQGNPAGLAGGNNTVPVAMHDISPAHSDGVMAATVLHRELRQPNRNDQPFTDHHDRSLLGGPMPFMIVPTTSAALQGTVRVAPLMMAGGSSFVAQVQHNGAVDTEMLADRMSRTGSRNVIGVAMQKIAPNTQGDIMLHDGV